LIEQGQGVADLLGPDFGFVRDEFDKGHVALLEKAGKDPGNYKGALPKEVGKSRNLPFSR
jgi:hypothetical protein